MAATLLQANDPIGKEMRRFNYDLLVGIGGLVTCAVTLAIGFWELTIASKEFVAYVPYPIAQWSMAIAEALTESPDGKTEAAFWIYVLLWFAHIALFALAYWLRVLPQKFYSPAVGTCLLVVQLAAAAAGQKPLLYLFAFEVAFLLPSLRAGLWLACGYALCMFVDLSSADASTGTLAPTDLKGTLLNLGYLGLYSAMHFAVGLLASHERNRRRQLKKAHTELASVNAELLATQLLFSQAERASERIRIARDIHDSIGHSLMAQTLHLDLAIRTCDSPARQPLQRAKELAAVLLSEIRSLVSAERAENTLDLGGALDTLAQDIVSPKITFELAQTARELAGPDADRVFRCIKEAIIDSVRYVGPSRLDIATSAAEGLAQIDVFTSGGNFDLKDSISSFAAVRNHLAGIQGNFRIRETEENRFHLDISFSL
jgi:signal transduction histidine kinase